MRRTSVILPLLAVLFLTPGCEDGTPWTDPDEPEVVETRDLGAPAAYARRLLFLGPGEPLPTAAIVDVTSLADGSIVRRGVRARLLTGDAWTSLMDTGWEMQPMREPWRILPGGDLGVTVSDAGELEAITIRGDTDSDRPAFRLQPGPPLAETSPDAGTRLILRRAAVAIDDEVVRGVLLDSQTGRAVHPAAVPSRLVTADSANPGEGRDSGDTAAADGAPALPEPPAGRPTPIARVGTEAVLVNDSGFYVVFATSATTDLAWITQADQDELRRGAALEPNQWAEADQGGVRRPTAWRIQDAGGVLSGELTAEAHDTADLADLGDVSALGYTLVSGWVESGGVRRDVFGLVRYVR